MSVTQFENNRWSQDVQKPEFRHTASLELIIEGPVLDIGCGDGLFMTMLHEKGIESEGLDLSSVAVAHAKEKGQVASVCDFTTQPLPYPDKSFPVVCALDVLEHVYDPESLLTEMARVAKEGIVISVPNFSSFPARIQTLMGKTPENNRPNKGHVYWFTYSVLQELIHKTGGEIVELKVNGIWEHVFIMGHVLKYLAKTFPSLFGLSFVVRIARP